MHYLANLVEASITTVTAGSPDTFTLSAVAGLPNFSEVFGSSGTIVVQYSAIQYTDSNRTEVSLAQGGIGSLDLSTGILTQSKIRWTWNAGTNAYDNTDPSELTFTAGATTTRVRISPSVEQLFHAPAVTAFNSGNDAIGHAPATVLNVTNVAGITNGRRYFIPFYWMHSITVSQMAVRVTATYSSTSDVSGGIWSVGSDGDPGALIADFGSIGNLNTGNVNIQSAALGTPIQLNPGMYYGVLLVTFSGGTGTPTLRGANHWNWPCHFARTSNGTPACYVFDSGASVGAALGSLNFVSNTITPIFFFE